MRYVTTQQNTYRQREAVGNYPRYGRDPETGEIGEFVSLRGLVWEFVKPVGMWLRLAVTALATGAMFALFLSGPVPKESLFAAIGL